MLQRLPIVLAQLKAGNTSENLQNEIRKIIYSLYRAKEITKKVHNNKMNSIKVIKQNGYYSEWINLFSEWFQRIVKHLILTDCHSIFRIK